MQELQIWRRELLPGQSWFVHHSAGRSFADVLDTYGAPYNHYEVGIDLPKKDMLGKQILSPGGLSSQLVLPMKDRLGTQIFSQGGFSSRSRVHEQFVFPIPGNIPSHEAAPMMCAGLTTYSALVHGECGPGKKVAILGIGGLGQFGILWAKALGAEVWALSHAPAKAETAIQLLGADHFVCCSQSRKWAKPLAFTFDFILNTADIINKHNVCAPSNGDLRTLQHCCAPRQMFDLLTLQHCSPSNVLFTHLATLLCSPLQMFVLLTLRHLLTSFLLGKGVLKCPCCPWYTSHCWSDKQTIAPLYAA
jgi:hypothetical protein